ncbi:hypothetical protein [Microbacterium sp. AK031]|uniref:hypothetical protein n=1 Tax=Microbacterium sp. AK031 TaxID=2723076 RepID=UPI002169F57E|nr:hypothetical protein [Microbacterium sp. AK031]MCS3844196.1 hypothetical protein [Microbacterium sp. AK031]
MGPEGSGSRPRALRDGTAEPRFAARYATIDEVAELLGVTPVSLRQTMRRRDSGDASSASDAFIDPIGNVSGYLWDRDDLTSEAIAAWHDRPRRGRKPNSAL